jgi:hypothetical protein
MEIKNIRHDLILSGYLQVFVDSVIKSSESNRPSSDTIYQGSAVFVPYVKGTPRNSDALETVSMSG